MNLCLLISLDPVADSFGQLVGPWTPAEETDLPAEERYWFRSTDWLAPSGADLRTSLGKLGDDILGRINHRKVEMVDIAFLLYAGDLSVVDLVPTVHRHLEGFLHVSTTRRLYVVYPRKVKALTEFSRRFRTLVEELQASEYGLCETNLMLAPQDVTAGALAWPAWQTEACRAVNDIGECRRTLDGLLTAIRSTTSSYGYARCTFFKDKWREYFLLRTQQDLIHREPVASGTNIGVFAGDAVNKTALISACYSVRADQAPPGPVTIKSGIEAESERTPLREVYEQWLTLQDHEHDRILEAEKPSIDRLRETYTSLLAEVLNHDRTSLAGFEEALCLHRTVLSIGDDPCSHGLFLAALLREDIVPVANRLIDGIRSLSEPGRASDARLQSLERLSSRRDIRRQVENLQSFLGSVTWKSEKRYVKTAFLRVLTKIDQIVHYVSVLTREESDEEVEAALKGSFVDLIAKTLIDSEIDEIVTKAFDDLDEEFDRLQQKQDSSRKSLRELETEYGLLKRLLHPFAHHHRRKAIVSTLREVGAGYQGWGRSVNTFISAIGPFLVLCGQLRLDSKLFQERRRVIRETGRILVEFDEALTRDGKRIESALKTIPEGPIVRERFELSFLSKSNMEQLYRKLGSPSVGDYIKLLMQDSSQSWGGWAMSHLMEYVGRLVPFCEATYRAMDEELVLDLPKLMFDNYFPRDLAEQRLVLLKGIASQGQLIPLVKENLNERWYHMMYHFPRDRTVDLRGFEPALTHEDRSVSLNPTTLAYVDQDDRMCLGLSMSLCGFRVEDSLFVGVFEDAETGK
jgi:hypothetical protein